MIISGNECIQRAYNYVRLKKENKYTLGHTNRNYPNLKHNGEKNVKNKNVKNKRDL